MNSIVPFAFQNCDCLKHCHCIVPQSDSEFWISKRHSACGCIPLILEICMKACSMRNGSFMGTVLATCWFHLGMELWVAQERSITVTSLLHFWCLLEFSTSANATLVPFIHLMTKPIACFAGAGHTATSAQCEDPKNPVHCPQNQSLFSVIDKFVKEREEITGKSLMLPENLLLLTHISICMAFDHCMVMSNFQTAHQKTL